MSTSLDTLYTDIVFEHDKHPRHAGLREDFTTEVHHVNPVCGDEITLRLHLDTRNERVEDISYDASGCAMSRASASIMAELMIGHTRAEIEPMLTHMEEVMTSRGKLGGDEDLIGDGVALSGAARFPGRVKCVLLPWKAYRASVLEALTLAQETL